MGPPPETLKEDNHTGGFHDTAGGLHDTWIQPSPGRLPSPLLCCLLQQAPARAQGPKCLPPLPQRVRHAASGSVSSVQSLSRVRL